ncbi:Ig-like domain-containing protein [Gilvimarinus sp. SDUM040013]|uniref:Ig-like domain-containing protein n=1 Tax=Gilvimarinus gilvus TaxID=3058038 RepID=A0ABU4RW77_9GAMM|nr:Ig-like domain-containing protein [Gilvimarinus sp. SDUM040013]MDO3386558.1 Ig-like domain-containing protein [Gilvimarinus sp. SDUM040013]MDX6849134.1 Ig-like domain-containing protein [Gilvimarinus sp. SDUM040013]
MNRSQITCIAAVSLGLFVVGCGSDDDYSHKEPAPEPENSAPVAQSAEFMTQADIALMDQLSATDADGDNLMYSVDMPPESGELALDADGSFMYTPKALETGTVSFTFVVSDGDAVSMPATVNIVVDPQMLSYSLYSLDVFNQAQTAEPLPVNGREFEQDVESPNAYDEIIQSSNQ